MILHKIENLLDHMSIFSFLRHPVSGDDCGKSPETETNPGLHNDPLIIRATIQSQGDRKSQGSNSDRIVCVRACAHSISF